MRIEKSQGYTDRVDIVQEKEDKKRYSLGQIQKIISDLDKSIQRFQEQKENWQSIYEQSMQKLGQK